MSLILEALKKSEAERAGRSPAPAGPTAGARRGTRRLVAAMAVIALLGVAAGWWGSRNWSARAPLVAAPSGPAPAVGQRRSPAAKPGDTVTGTAAHPDRSAAAMDSAPAPPPEGVLTERLTPVDTREGDQPETRAAQAIPSARPPGPSPAAEAAPAARSPGPPDPRPESAPEPSDGSRVPSERMVPATLAAAATAPAGTAGSESEGALPHFDQLPGLREEFGELKLNMLVYAARPQARFALINLTRFVEGDQVQPGLEIKEIRRDGVVLSLRGQAVLLSSRH